MLISSSSFQFTHPGRGATRAIRQSRLTKTVSIHAPREGCDFYLYPFCISELVSIHAPREGCDVPNVDVSVNVETFQFTHPGRGATWIFMNVRAEIMVSIHAPREGCDWRRLFAAKSIHSFNSRTPGGVRPNQAALQRMREQFQFTHPGRGATLPSCSWLTHETRFQFTHPGRGATA